jgi:hypothetical protein
MSAWAVNTAPTSRSTTSSTRPTCGVDMGAGRAADAAALGQATEHRHW